MNKEKFKLRIANRDIASLRQQVRIKMGYFTDDTFNFEFSRSQPTLYKYLNELNLGIPKLKYPFSHGVCVAYYLFIKPNESLTHGYHRFNHIDLLLLERDWNEGQNKGKEIVNAIINSNNNAGKLLQRMSGIYDYDQQEAFYSGMEYIAHLAYSRGEALYMRDFTAWGQFTEPTLFRRAINNIKYPPLKG